MSDEHPRAHNDLSGHVVGDVTQIGEQRNYYVGPRLPKPRQLPPAPRLFVNRTQEMGMIDALSQRGGGGVPVVVLTGTRGVGKTATGQHWANVNGDRFADGQLYVDFGEPGDRGAFEVSDVLGGFLRAFGVPDEMIPADFAERRALFRSSTAGKRILVLLDDVDSAAQVQALIPNAPEGMVLVTSKSPVEELIHDGADVIRLAPLDADFAAAILTRMIGSERAHAEPRAVEELAQICAGLPVALRICGARLAGDPARRIGSLIAELADEERRLERIALTADRSIEAVFADAYRRLSAPAAAVYRHLGVHPGPSFTVPLVAAGAAVPVDVAHDLLGELRAAQLVEGSGRGMRFHELLRIHARATAEREHSDAERAATLRRIVDFHVVAAQRMDRAITPDRLRLARECSSGCSEPTFDSPESAFEWFEEERGNLLAVMRAAAERRWDMQVWYLGEALWPPYHNKKHFGEALEVYELAVASAQRLGDVGAEARLRIQLLRAFMDLEDYDGATRELAAAHELADRSGDPRLVATALEFAGVLNIALGRYRDAIAVLERGRTLSREIGNSRGTALQEYHLGRALFMAGEHERAVVFLGHAAELVDGDRDGPTMARIRAAEGDAHHARGDTASARAAFEEALEITGRHRIPYYEATVRERLAAIELEDGGSAAARTQWERALQVYSALGSPRAERVRACLDAAPEGSPATSSDQA